MCVWSVPGLLTSQQLHQTMIHVYNNSFSYNAIKIWEQTYQLKNKTIASFCEDVSDNRDLTTSCHRGLGGGEKGGEGRGEGRDMGHQWNGEETRWCHWNDEWKFLCTILFTSGNISSLGSLIWSMLILAKGIGYNEFGDNEFTDIANWF